MAMAEIETNLEDLPEDVKEKLAELDLELSEGEWPSLALFEDKIRKIFIPKAH